MESVAKCNSQSEEYSSTPDAVNHMDNAEVLIQEEGVKVIPYRFHVHNNMQILSVFSFYLPIKTTKVEIARIPLSNK